MTKYFLPGLTKAQADALDRSGCGDFTLSGVSPKTLKKLLDEELLRQCGEKIICRDRFGTVAVPEYEMPLRVHIQWTFWNAKQFENEQPAEGRKKRKPAVDLPSVTPACVRFTAAKRQP
jgi:hypothetical protein